MKNLKYIIISILLSLGTNFSYSQESFSPFTDCPMPGIATGGSSASFVGGLYKPHRTDLSGGIPSVPEARFNILVVFVQFSNETEPSGEWPIGDTPVYKSDLLASIKDTSGNYWDRYDENTELLSDWFQEVSKGRMHVTGEAFTIILDKPDTYYASEGMTVMNNEISFSFYIHFYFVSLCYFRIPV